jgi:hypothetical protein
LYCEICPQIGMRAPTFNREWTVAEIEPPQLSK